MDNKIYISCIILSNLNDLFVKKRTIPSIIENSKTYNIEIIVVDNNSNDESLNIVRHFVHDPLLNSENSRNYTEIKIVNIDQYTPGNALNKGIEKASRDYILIISAHCILKKINLNNLFSKLRDYIAIFGNQTPLGNGKKINKRYIWSHFLENEKENMFSDLENRFFFHMYLFSWKKRSLSHSLRKTRVVQRVVRSSRRTMINL